MHAYCTNFRQGKILTNCKVEGSFTTLHCVKCVIVIQTSLHACRASQPEEGLV